MFTTHIRRAAVLVMSLMAVSTAHAATLTADGVSLTAPDGFQLSKDAQGAYVLSSPTRHVTFFRVGSGMPLDQIAAQIGASSGATGSPTPDGNRVRVPTANGTIVVMKATAAGARDGHVDVVKIAARDARGAGPATQNPQPGAQKQPGAQTPAARARAKRTAALRAQCRRPGKKSRALRRRCTALARADRARTRRPGVRAAQAAPLRPPTAAEIADTMSIMDTRTTQALTTIPGMVNVASCAAPDFGSRALTPVGIVCDGHKGSFSAVDANGFALLGQSLLLSTTGLPGGPPNAVWQSPEQAVTQVLPAALQFWYKSNLAVTSATPIPGTEGILGAGIPSQMFAINGTIDGKPINAVALVGGLGVSYADTGSWQLYVSMVAVSTTAPAGTGDAFMTTWRTWDPSQGIRDRLADIANTLRSTSAPSGGINPAVFDRANANWGAYLRS